MTSDWWWHYALPALISSLPVAAVSLLGVWLQNRKTRRHVEQVTRQQTAQLLAAGHDGDTDS